MSDEQEMVPLTGSALIEDGDRDLYAAAAQRFPVEAHQTDTSRKITYLPGEDIISRMNRVFVYGWESEIMEHGIHEEAEEVWVRMRVTIWRKATTRTITVEESAGTDTPTKTVTMLTEQLVSIRREQFGSQKIKRARSTGRILDIGFDLKGAATDAIKKTVSLLGVGLYLWNKEELALIEWAKKEMEQEQRQQGRNNGNNGQQESPQTTQGRFRRPNRSGSQGQGDRAPQESTGSQDTSPADDGTTTINGIRMPDGFQQPFALVEQGKDQNQCRAEQCGTVIDPNADYPVGNEQKKGGYVMKRAREMAGTILCSSHAAQWHRAMATAKQATVA